MDDAAKVAFVIAQSACCAAEIAAMQAENAAALARRAQPFWTGEDFRAVPAKFQIGWNEVITYLRS